MRRVLGVLAGLMVLVVFAGALFTVRILTNAGFFSALAPGFDGRCTAYSGITGAEDLQIDRETGWVYLSATDRRAIRDGQNLRGDIYAMRLDSPETGFLPLTADTPGDFRPHGISLYTGLDGRKRVFTVSHPALGRSRIEIFDLDDDGMVPILTHIRSVEDPLFPTPNDVVAVGPDQFYVTNDHAFKDGFRRIVEDVLRLNQSTLVYFDGEEARIAADKLTYPNGVNVSPDGSELYVTETTDGMLRVYGRDRETGALSARALSEGRLFIGLGLDNIDVDKRGALWIASHPKLLSFLAHADDPDRRSPSMINKVTLDAVTRRGVIDQVYLNLGEEISGASVAAVHNGQMVVGSVFEPKILVCDLPITDL